MTAASATPPTAYVPPPQPQASAPPQPQPVSGWWWLLPIFFGILGGVVAYIGVRDRDAKKAKNMLILSIVLTVILAMLWTALIFATLGSLGR